MSTPQRGENACGCVAVRVTEPVIKYVAVCENHFSKLEGIRLVGPDSPAVFREQKPRTNLKAQEASVDILWTFAKAVAALAREDARLLTTDPRGATHSSGAFLPHVHAALQGIAEAHGYTLTELQ